MNQRISLYIPCHNAAEYLARVLSAALAQTLPADELLVIDDGSRDATCAIASRYPVTTIRHQTNLGLAAARNTAFRAARNELVAALDADCVAEPRWLEILATRLETEKLDGIGGRLVETVLDSVPDRWRATHMPQHWGERPLAHPRFLFGNNTLLRKSAVERAGGYDQRMRTNGEDSDLSSRMRAQGAALAYEPAAVVRHLRRDSVLSLLDTYWRWWRCAPNSYLNGITLGAVLRNAWRVHFRAFFISTALADLRRRNFELLPLDLLMLLNLPLRDLRLWMASPAPTASARVSNEISS